MDNPFPFKTFLFLWYPMCMFLGYSIGEAYFTGPTKHYNRGVKDTYEKVIKECQEKGNCTIDLKNKKLILKNDVIIDLPDCLESK